METTNYGHLSRQLEDIRNRLAVGKTPFELLCSEFGSLNFLVPEINRLERIVSALESIGVNLDEEDIQGLEWIAELNRTHSERSFLRDHLNRAIRESQWDRRETEHKEAIDALTTAGFVLNDEDGTWNKDGVTVKIELTNGRESRYKWEYERHDPKGVWQSIHNSGVSGEFHRLLKLIGMEVTV